MPYNNLPKSKWKAMEECVARVKQKKDIDNPYAVCYSAIIGIRKIIHKKVGKTQTSRMGNEQNDRRF